MASALLNPWLWLRGGGHARSPHDFLTASSGGGERRRRRDGGALASVSLGGAGGGPALVADIATSSSGAVSREDLGRSTWLLLHTLAAQYPDDPTRQQEKDVRNLIDILTRVYPCGECARHFAEIVKQYPPDTSSGMALQQWMCGVHNAVNDSLGKPRFNCAVVDARWGGVDCDEEDACSLDARRRRKVGGGAGGGGEGVGGGGRLGTYIDAP